MENESIRKGGKDDSSSNIRMDEEQAMGYMLLTCREIGLSIEQVNQIHSNVISQFHQRSPEEAKKQGEEWYRSIQEKKINPSKSNSLENQMPKPVYKRAKVRIAKVPESPYTKKLRKQYERIIAEEQQMQDGPFGLYRSFRGCKR